MLALHRGERHGYALIGDVDALTGGVVRLGPGTLYRSLQRMRVEGWIEELDTPSDPALAAEDFDRRAERRRRYRLTAAGRVVARAEADRLRRLVSAAVAAGVVPEPTVEIENHL